MKCLEDGYIVAKFCKVSCAGKTCRAGTDNRDLVAVFLCCRNRFDTVFFCPVSNETLQFTDGNSIAFDSADTFALALALLRTYTAADCRECTGLTDNFVCFLEVSFFYLCNECRNVDINRASCDTFCIFTAQAALCFFYCFVFVVSKTYLVKICGTYLRLLLTYRYSV